MKKYLVALFLVASPAFAADTPDPDYLTRLVNILQAQRNQALDSLTISQAQVAKLTDDLAKANKRIEELEKSQTPKK